MTKIDGDDLWRVYKFARTCLRLGIGDYSWNATEVYTMLKELGDDV